MSAIQLEETNTTDSKHNSNIEYDQNDFGDDNVHVKDSIWQDTEQYGEALQNALREVLDGQLDSPFTLKSFCNNFGIRHDIEEHLFNVFVDHASKEKKRDVLTFNDFINSAVSIAKGSQTDQIRFLFEFHDLDGDGKVTRDEVRQVISASATGIEDDVIDDLTNLLFEDIDENHDEHITFEEFYTYLKNRPLIIANLHLSSGAFLYDTLVSNRSASFHRRHPVVTLAEDKLQEHVPLHQRRTTWSNTYNRLCRKKGPYIVSYLLIILANLALGIWRGIDISNDGANVWVSIAKGCGICLNLDCAIILFPVARLLLTKLRETFFHHIVPIDRMIDLHRLLGYLIAFLGTVHSIAHMINLADISGYEWWEAYFTTKPDIGFFKGLAPITGFILLVLIAVMTLFALNCIRGSGYFNLFYYSHMLYPLVYIGLFFHAPTFWKWVLLPGTLFVIELLFKYLSGSAYGRGTQILELIALPHGVTRLCIAKPGNWNFNAGEYAFLRYPTLSSFEWHPFTISSAPETEGVVGFHIRSLGNWTTALYNLAKSKPIDDYSHEYMYETENQDDEKDEENLDRSSSGTAALSKSKRNFTSSDNFNSWNKIYILGPYHSTACDAMLEAEHAILIGAGIGVTPYSSILHSLWYRHRKAVRHPDYNGEDVQLGKLKKVDFYWICGSQQKFSWLLDLLETLEREQTESHEFQKFITLHVYLTRAKTHEDVSAFTLEMALDLLHQRKGHDAVTKLAYLRTHPGKPLWHQHFSKYAQNNMDSTVFFCGPRGFASYLEGICNEYGLNFKQENF